MIGDAERPEARPATARPDRQRDVEDRNHRTPDVGERLGDG